jgi:hypothetical protein
VLPLVPEVPMLLPLVPEVLPIDPEPVPSPPEVEPLPLIPLPAEVPPAPADPPPAAPVPCANPTAVLPKTKAETIAAIRRFLHILPVLLGIKDGSLPEITAR